MLLLTCPSVRSSTTIFRMPIVTIEPLGLDSGNSQGCLLFTAKIVTGPLKQKCVFEDIMWYDKLQTSLAQYRR